MSERGVGPAADGGTGASGRAQTNLDFAFGVSIFMITVIVALTFVPNLFAGIGGGLTQSNQVVADRVASGLANGNLGDPSRPGQLDVDCTASLFSASYSSCGYVQGFADNIDRLRAINVTIINDERACLDEDTGDVVPRSSSDCTPSTDDDTVLNRNIRMCYDGNNDNVIREDGTNAGGIDNCGSGAAADVVFVGGGQPPSDAEIALAQRATTVRGRQLTLVVRVW